MIPQNSSWCLVSRWYEELLDDMKRVGTVIKICVISRIRMIFLEGLSVYIVWLIEHG